jgi:hypothetical protein
MKPSLLSLNRPGFNLDKIKFATDAPTFARAVKLYESGRVGQVKREVGNYTALVRGTKPYRVYIDGRRYGYANCTCYLGQRDILCKHAVALAIYAVKDGEALTDEEKKQVCTPVCSRRRGVLSDHDLKTVKKTVTSAMRYIKPYYGPSRIWFAYQDSLSEGCNRLSAIVADLPVSKQTADLLVNLLLRLDKKLCTGGVDDSDGTVGGFIGEAVAVLKEYAQVDPACIKSFSKLKDRETCFGWEEPLLSLIADEG